MSEQLAFTFDAPNPTRPAPYTVTCADVLAWARTYSGKPFHCLLADPPYSLGDGKKGFMNAAWDTNIAFKPETWKVLAQHLLPGAFLMCFGGARTYHRLACALEDAGLIIHPALGFLQGQGFPKATGITDERFSGHRYGLQAMKPAIEFIALAQVPYSSKPFSSITQTGAGALNIDGGRISLPPGDKVHAGTVSTLGSGKADGWVRPWMNDLHTMNDKNAQAIARGNALGRWPPNFALSHTAQCVRVGERSVKGITGTACGVRATGGQSTAYGKFNGTGRYGEPTGYADATGHETVDEYRCADNCPVAKLDAQAGERKSAYPGNPEAASRYAGQDIPDTGVCYGKGLAGASRSHSDTGGASRFFHVSDFSLDIAERLAQADPVFYCAKASRRERDSGLEGMPAIVGFNKNTSQWKADARHPDGGYINNLSQVRNPHPTVKPLKLCQWLAALLLPPAAYAPRRLVIPFSGSGSEGIGAMLAGWDEIVMIDSGQSYVDLATHRLAYWVGMAR